MEPLDGVGEVLKVGDRVAFQPPHRMIVGRITEVVQPAKIAMSGQQGQPFGRVKIELEIDHLYGVQMGQVVPLEAVFKLAAANSGPRRIN